MRVIAFMHAYNEEDIVSQTLEYLIGQGIEIYFIDHGSSDKTVHAAVKWLNKGVIHVEKNPGARTFALREILRRIEILSTQLFADWFLINDADEFRESPWPGLTLKEAFFAVDQMGYNAIDFELFNFQPVDNRFISGMDPRKAIRYYVPVMDKINFMQIKAWKNLGMEVDIVSNSGHNIVFPSRKIFPIKFILRHYPIRNQSHGFKKIFKERGKRYSKIEKEFLGMHVQYDHVKAEDCNFLGNPNELMLWNGDKVRLGLLSEPAFRTLDDEPAASQKLISLGIARDPFQDSLKEDLFIDPLIEKLSSEIYSVVLQRRARAALFTSNKNSKIQSLLMTGELAFKKRNYLGALSSYQEAIELASDSSTRSIHPKISVILPVSDSLLSLHLTLKSFLEVTSHQNLEFMVVNCSKKPEIEEYLRRIQISPITTIWKACSNSTAASNLGVSLAAGDYLFLIQPFFRVNPGWAKFFLDAFSENFDRGEIFPKIVDERETLIEAGFSRVLPDGIYGYGAGSNSSDPGYNIFRRNLQGSRFCAFMKRKDFSWIDGLSEEFSSYSLALLDFHRRFVKKGGILLYNPLCEIILQKEPGLSQRLPNKTSQKKGLDLPEYALNEKRPRINICFKIPERKGKWNVLLVGVYLKDKPNFKQDISDLFSQSKTACVKQKWIPLNLSVNRMPKFKLINSALEKEDLDQYDYLFITDDDIILPFEFLDQFLYLQANLDFAIAQPSRTLNSKCFYSMTFQHKGVVARQTLLIDSGPLVSFHRSIYSHVIPFDLSSPMGWGYENIWAYLVQKQGMKMGLIDNTPVDHSIRDLNQYYDEVENDKKRIELLSRHPHIPFEKIHLVLDVISAERLQHEK